MKIFSWRFGTRKQQNKQAARKSSSPGLHGGYRQLGIEGLEPRAMLSVTLASIVGPDANSAFNVAAGKDLYVPLTGSDVGNVVSYAATSSDPNVKVSVLAGNPTLQLTVQGTNASNQAFSGVMTLQLFQNLAPNTVSAIESLVNSHFYDGLTFYRIVPGFVIQGGANSSKTAPTFNDEFNADLAFNSPGLLAMANPGTVNSNTSEFFITDPTVPVTSDPQYLSFRHSIFGQLTSGFDVYNNIKNALGVTSSNSSPTSSVTITSASIITDTQNGVLKISEPIGYSGTATINVTANGSDGSSAARSFSVVAAPAATTSATAPLVLLTNSSTTSSISNQTTLANTPVSFTITAAQAQQTQVTFTVTGDSSFNGSLANVTAQVSSVTTAVNGQGVTIGSKATVTLTPTSGFTGTVYLLAHVDDAANNVHDVLPFTLTVNPTAVVKPATLSGSLFIDYTQSNLVLSGDKTVPNTLITLTGTDSSNHSVTQTTTTTADGSYSFSNLAAGTYDLTATATAPLSIGSATSGNLGGTVAGIHISHIVVTSGAVGTNYNFVANGFTPTYIVSQGINLFLNYTPSFTTLINTYTPNSSTVAKAKPTITAIANQTVGSSNSSNAIGFTVADTAVPVTSLSLTGSSSNTTLLPIANIVYGGSGANRTITVTPAAGQTGTATVTTTVSDGLGGTASTSFVLTVNGSPTISSIAAQTTVIGSAKSDIAFTVADGLVPVSSLTTTGTSSNTSLVPNANIVYSGTGTRRTLTVTPVAGQVGTATITTTVNDGLGGSSTTSFVLTVNALPTISAIAAQSTGTGVATTAIPFTLADASVPVANLTVSGMSSNATLVPNGNIVYSGTGASRAVTVTPATGQSGTATITTLVSDGAGGLAVNSFVLTVNGSAAVSTIANQSTAIGTATSPIAFTVGDTVVPVASLTVTGSSSNTTLVPNANIVYGGSGTNRTLVITPAAGQTGTATITTTVSDSTGSTATSSFILTVNALPTIATIANQTIQHDTATNPIAVTLGSTSSVPVGNLTLTASSSNTSLVPNANIVVGGSGANRTLVVTPTAGQSGTATITATVNDGAGGTAQTSFVVTVNSSAAISTIADHTTAFNTATGAITFTVGDTSVPLANLTVGGSSSNLALVPNANIVYGGSGANRTVTVTPVTGQSGTATITTTVSDGVGGTASTSFTLTVNAPPTLTTVANQTIAHDTATSALAITLGSTSSVPVGSLTLSGSSSNTTLVPNANIVYGGTGANRTVTVTPAAGLAGSATITTTVNDGAGSTAQMTFVLTVNSSATITPIADQSTAFNTATGPIAFTLADTSVSVNTLTVNGTSSNTTLVPNANIVYSGTGANRTVTITPATGQSGTATITTFVTDGTSGATTTATFVLTVNSLPTITTIPNQTTAINVATTAAAITVGSNLPATSLTLSGSSSDQALVPDANIVFGGSGANRSMTITPATDQTGTATITVTVDDGAGGTAQETLTITVNTLPIVSGIADQVMVIDTASNPIAFTVVDTSVDPNSLTITGTSSNQTLVKDSDIVYGGTGSNRTVTIIPESGQQGSATITTKVDDGFGGVVTTTFLFTVTPAQVSISTINPQNTTDGVATSAINFTVDAVQVPAGSVTVTGTSSNTVLVPDVNIVLGGSGQNRTVTVTPVTGGLTQSVDVTITLTVDDGLGHTASKPFVLTITP